MINDIIFNYKITREIGAGGMATVYEAEHVQLGTKAAIKVMHKNLTNNEAIRQRFANEAQTLYRLSHPAIVRLLNYEEKDNQLIIVMDYVEGIDLKSYLEDHPEMRKPERAIPFFLQVLDAIGHAHEQGIIHRDIKPSNIMVTAGEKPILLDFGIAKLLDDVDSSLTGTSALLGSRPYMSPEQIQSSKHIDHRSDIYSLGVTLYHLLAGEAAYDLTSSEWDMMNKIVNDPLPSIRQKNKEVSPALESMISKATAKDPASRYQTCAEFAEALKSGKAPMADSEETIIDETRTPRPSAWATTEAADPPSTDSSTANAPKQKEGSTTKSGNKMPMIVGAVAVVLVAAGALTYFSSRSSNGPTPEPVTEELSQGASMTEDNNVYTKFEVEKPPAPPSGFQGYLKENLQYPDMATRIEVEGEVMVSYIVEKDGTLSDVKVIRGIAAGCDEEAVRLLRNAPAFTPGELNGIVRVADTTTISFRLPRTAASNKPGTFDAALAEVLNTDNAPNTRAQFMSTLGGFMADNAIISVVDNNGLELDRYTKNEFLRFAVTTQTVSRYEVKDKSYSGNQLKSLEIAIFR